MNRSWKLFVADGPEKGREFDLPTEGALVIGRGSDSDTRLRDPQLSRIHCEVRCDGEGWVVADCGGSGGTTLDATKLEEPRPLVLGSMIRVGDSLIRVVDASERAEVQPLQSGALPADSPAGSPSGSMDDLVGHQFQAYRIGAAVSSGLNSVVFHGIETTSNEEVALKVLRPQVTQTDEQRQRFIRAVKTMQPVSHPNIVRLRDAGTDDGYCWAAMDWIEGTSAAKLIAKIGIGGMLDWREAFRCGFHLSRALVAASEAGIVHRNITPANILRRESDQQYLLSDLVLAKALETTEAAQLTKPGDILGDLGYLAPERVLDVTRSDVRSDFYGLGATMYALLTGVPPYPATSVAEWLEAVNGEAPTSPAGSQMGMDERLSDLIMRLIKKDPADRFETAQDVLDDFQRVGTFAGIDVSGI